MQPDWTGRGGGGDEEEEAFKYSDFSSDIGSSKSCGYVRTFQIITLYKRVGLAASLALTPGHGRYKLKTLYVWSGIYMRLIKIMVR